MFCDKCGVEVPDDSLFCIECGNKLEPIDNISAKETAATIETIATDNQIPKKAMSKKQKILSLIIGVIIILGAATYQVGNYLTSPEYVAKMFCSAMANKDFQGSDQYIEFPAELAEMKNEYIKAANLYYQDSSYITSNFKIVPSKENKDSLSTVIIAKYINDSKEEDVKEIALTKGAKKKYLLFPDWKVTFNDSIVPTVSNWQICIPEGAKLFINNEPIQESKVTTNKEPIYASDSSLIGNRIVYTFKMMYDLTYNVKAEIDSIIETKDNVHPTEYIELTNFFIENEEQKAKLTKLVENYLLKGLQKFNTGNLALKNEYAVENSQAEFLFSKENMPDEGNYKFEIKDLVLTEINYCDANSIYANAFYLFRNANEIDYFTEKPQEFSEEKVSVYLKKVNNEWKVFGFGDYYN